MPDDLWLSLALGGGMGLLYSVAAHFSARRAIRKNDRRFFARYFGEMMLRMAGVLILMILGLVFLPVHEAAFVGALVGVVSLGIIQEVVSLQYGRLSREAAKQSRSGQSAGD